LLALEGRVYQDQLDSYKILLGLPPDLNVQVVDPFLNRLDLITPEMTATQDAVDAVVDQLRERGKPLPEGFADVVASVLRRVQRQLQSVEEDVEHLDQSIPSRSKTLSALAQQPEVVQGLVDPTAYSPEALRTRAASVRSDLVDIRTMFLASIRDLDEYRQKGAASPESREGLIEVLEDISNELAELSLVQARARVDAVGLVHVDLSPDEALRIARSCRPDWMNARTALVDVWRQIEVRANALQSDFNFLISGDINTTDNNPLQFRSSTGRLRFGFEFDAPLTRVAERNAYRTAQIAYLRELRNYYSFEDQVNQVLRAELRELRRAQLDFEVRRARVFNAIAQVDFTQSRIRSPVPPGKTGSNQLSPTTTRDLVQALSSLLDAQNSFLRTWVDYEVQRMNLDFDLGTMQLDDRCMWVDPGPIDGHYTRNLGAPPPEPPNLPMPPELVPTPDAQVPAAPAVP
jgi:hypothetical protein